MEVKKSMPKWMSTFDKPAPTTILASRRTLLSRIRNICRCTNIAKMMVIYN